VLRVVLYGCPEKTALLVCALFSPSEVHPRLLGARFKRLGSRLLLLLEQLVDFLLHVCLPLVQLSCQLRLKASLYRIDLPNEVVLGCPHSLIEISTPRIKRVCRICDQTFCMRPHFIITHRHLLTHLFDTISQLATALVHILGCAS